MASIVGIAGLCCFDSSLLLVTLLDLIMSIILSFVIMSTLGFDDLFLWIGTVTPLFLIVLFWYNYKLVMLYLVFL